MEEEERSQPPDRDHFLNASIFSHDAEELRLSQVDIAQPSPSFGRGPHFLEELVVVGTHLRIHQSPGLGERQREAELARKRSEEEFIEDILEINFDQEAIFR